MNDLPKVRRELIVVSDAEAEGLGVIRYTGEGTVIARGSDPVVYVCGACGAELLDGTDAGNLVNAAFSCNACGAINRR